MARAFACVLIWAWCTAILAAPQGPTVAEVKRQHQSLLEFFQALPSTQEFDIWTALMLGGLAGMITSFLIKWSQGQIKACLTHYFFRDNPRGTVYSVLWLIAAVGVNVSISGYSTTDGDFVGWGKVLLDGWLIGGGGDLALNKAKRPEWTEADRAEKTGG